MHQGRIYRSDTSFRRVTRLNHHHASRSRSSCLSGQTGGARAQRSRTQERAAGVSSNARETTMLTAARTPGVSSVHMGPGQRRRPPPATCLLVAVEQRVTGNQRSSNQGGSPHPPSASAKTLLLVTHTPKAGPSSAVLCSPGPPPALHKIVSLTTHLDTHFPWGLRPR